MEEWCLNWDGWTGEEVRVHFKTSITNMKTQEMQLLLKECSSAIIKLASSVLECFDK